MKRSELPLDPAQMERLLQDPLLSLSFGQEGEDLLIDALLEGPADKRGFYIDVGAHHPRRFSNTYVFYLKGWSGINIDPNPDGIKAFQATRPRDVNLGIGVAPQAASLTYFMFDDAALNTFDPDRARYLEANTPYRLVDRMEAPVQPLAQVLDAHLPPGQAIDFLTVDAEGMDLAALSSNDWTRYRPTLVIAEDGQANTAHLSDNPLVRFMDVVEYFPVARLPRSIFFRQRSC